jgi:hypothetical protein
MKGQVYPGPALERTFVEFMLAKHAHIPPSELAHLSQKKVMQFYTILKVYLKEEEKEIRRATKR